ncbi:MAG: endonuclease MutS2 [Kouleothrix sp.]|jgi:DNA mismatch repair protein MutS2|nr:endonuclease MutS2 [Kouleothrix sp.]
MSISAQTLETLEFPKILDRLARHTAFSASRELALGLQPTTDAYQIRRQIALTSEARHLLDERPDISIGGARDIRGPVGLARRGGVLEASVLLEVSATLASGRRLRGQLLKLDVATFGLLNELAHDLPSLPAVEDAITTTIGDDGTVLDSASPLLGRLRSDIRVAYGRLHDKLQNMISSTQYADALQEPIITVRNGRYVLPVKAAHKRNLRGLVHDQSASGATLYIEPLVIVELNNRWRELQLAEEEEVARILAELSGRVGEHAQAIVAGVEAIAQIDLGLAKAKYALALRCVAPEIRDVEGSAATDTPNIPSSNVPHANAPLVLTQARHPLLDQHTVVPTDLVLGGDFRILLITGPNTGGKTVALKTCGLLALMAQAGLHVPAAAPARLPVFGQIFADIGDEQSIEQSLSTFSSHMTNIVRILGALEQARADWQSAEPEAALVLLDELGAGTDPVEGAALARAIIERLLELRVLGVATTHYAELKAFAYATAGVENGSVEFDVETLAPTYRLTIGIPGRSNALAIATRLGLEPGLVERARSMMAREDTQVEDLLAGIHRERAASAAELQRVEDLRADAEKYRDRLAAELREFEQRRDAEWQGARDQIDDELREVRGQLRRLRDEFRSVSLTRQWMEEAEQRLQQVQSQAKDVQRPPLPKIAEAVAAPAPAEPAAEPIRPLQAGDTVLVRSVGLVGEILSIDEDDSTAEVQVGGFRMQANLAELRRETRGERKSRSDARRAEPSRATLPAAPDVAINFDMRGWRAGEVADKLERYLNDAYLAGLPFVRLIHGKGTGALRQIVRDVLKAHPLVASFGGGGADGGEGVTVARMAER